MNNVQTVFPLSPMQEGMLFHTLQSPESAQYFKQVSMALAGDLDQEAFHKAWQCAVQQFGVLRTCFIWEGVKQPVQAILDRADLNWLEADWRAIPEVEQADRLAEYLASDRLAGFDLTKPSLSRGAVIRTSDNAYQFIWSFHHIILDGWSIPLLLKHVFDAYDVLRAGGQFRVEQEASYRDYVLWLNRQDAQQAEQFWKQYLKGFQAPTPLPLRRSHTLAPGDDKGHSEYRFTLQDRITSGLQSLCRDHRLTLSTVLQAAWGLLLRGASGNEDVLFGAVVSGRPPEVKNVEKIVGMLVNTVPVRLAINPQQDFLSFCRQIQSRQAETREFEYTPLLRVQDCSELPKRQFLFDSIFVFEGFPAKTSATRKDLVIRSVESYERTTFPLAITFTPGDALSGLLSYETASFSTRSIQSIAESVETILESLLADPFQLLARISQPLKVATPSIGRITAYPRQATIPALFEEQVEGSPEACAIVFQGAEISYRDLNQRANRVAARLRKLGVGPDTLVGLAMDRSVEIIVGMLAVLKCGGAYVPLDPSYPAERTVFLVEDTACRIILAQHSTEHYFAGKGVEVVSLDPENFRHESSDNLLPACGPENLAYVMYTSGSTGKPKGVAVCHRSVIRLVRDTDYFSFGPSEVFLQSSAVSFDAATFEIWGALLNGARLVVPEPGLQTVEGLSLILLRYEVTVLFLTTGLFHVMADSQLDGLATLRNLFAGGDVLSPARVQKAVRELPACRFTAVYGPTENTTFSTFCPISTWSPEWSSVPIGRPIANGAAFVLDEALRRLPVGSPGELYLAGDGLARGYWKRPDLTSERFLECPFSNGMMYRTGDRARFMEDGNLEFLGRIDTQVKVRGFRIEPSEVEHVLNENPSVQDSAVVTAVEEQGEKRLVAFVVLKSGQTATGKDLREYLGRRLPEYMMPTRISLIDRLPLSPTGKVDRPTLASLPVAAPGPAVLLSVPPETAAERTLYEIWADVLQAGQFGIDDNFFDLGGDSIISIKIVSRAARAGLAITLKQIFKFQTIRELAAVAQAAPLTRSAPAADTRTSQISQKDLGTLLARIK